MKLSASILGREYGLSPQEMNRALLKKGFLTGEPGNYETTAKAVGYAEEIYHHRGTGGYSCYNRYWKTIKFDESIKDVLNITPEFIQEVKQEIANERTERLAKQAVERAEASARFLAEQEAKRLEEARLLQEEIEYEEFIKKFKRNILIALGLAGCCAIGYGIYINYPKIKNWWNKKTSKKEVSNKNNDLDPKLI